MISKFIKSALSLLLVIFLFSCNDVPNSVGSDLFEKDFNNELLTLQKFDSNIENVTVSNEYFTNFDTSAYKASRILIGKRENVTANALVIFGIQISEQFKQDMINGKLSVLEATIEMASHYKEGDSTKFNFNVYKITEKWDEKTITDASFNNLAYSRENIFLSKTFTDSSTIIKLKPEIVLEWIKAIAIPDKFDNNGLVFIPTEDTKSIMGYYSKELDGSSTGIVLNIKLDGTDKLNNTVSAIPAVDMHILKSLQPVVPVNMGFVQGGVPYNSKLNFDLSKLPSGLLINKAELQITIDSTLSNRMKTGILYVSLFKDATHTLADPLVYGTQMNRNKDILTANVTELVQRIANLRNNYGFKLSLSNEPFSTASFVFYSGNNDVKRPKLLIDYATRKGTK